MEGNTVFLIYTYVGVFYLTGAAQQKVQRREMTGKAAKLAAAGACAFALVQPVMAANKKRKIEPVGCCKAHVHPHTGTLSRFLAFILAVATHTQKHTHRNTHTQTQTNTHKHTQTHTHTHAQTHAHTHTHTHKLYMYIHLLDPTAPLGHFSLSLSLSLSVYISDYIKVYIHVNMYE